MIMDKLLKQQALIAKRQRESRAIKTESKNAAKGLPPLHHTPGKLSATGTVRSTAGRRKTFKRRR